MTERTRPPGTCWARGDWGDRCTDHAGHQYAHYDASNDTSWTDRSEDHPDGCTCDVCQPDDKAPERDRRTATSVKKSDMNGLTEDEMDILATSFATATRSPHHLAFLAQPAVETIVAQREAAAWDLCHASVCSCGEDGVSWTRTHVNPFRANRSEGGRA